MHFLENSAPDKTISFPGKSLLKASQLCCTVHLCWIVWWSCTVLRKSSCRWLLAQLHFNVSGNGSLTQVEFNLWLRSSSLRHEDLWHKQWSDKMKISFI